VLFIKGAPQLTPVEPNSSVISENLALIRGRIAAAARLADRDVAQIELVAVSKTHPSEAVRAALTQRQFTFGENRVQEAATKFPALRSEFPQLRLHLIGPLQSNKAIDAVRLFDIIETVDRPKIAAALAAAMAKLDRRPDCFVQINSGEEPQKAGVSPVDAPDFVAECRTKYALPIIGLMCIPPVDQPPAPHFALVREIARRCGLQKLSMGMSSDFETAIRCGATSVRVGSAIFGERPKVPG
jgi:pyridoxal phosphate enzyme (YggS family)